MEKFFMIVTFILSDPTVDTRPLYIFSKPYFDTYNECYSYVNENPLKLYNTAIASYNMRYVPENIFCVNDNVMKDLFEYNYGNKENKEEV